MALTYSFQLPGNFALSPVVVYNTADVQQTTGTTDSNARFTAELEAGDYYAEVGAGRRIKYRAAGTVDRGDEDAFGGGTDVVDASTTVKGIVELATNAETTTGTDTVRATTPAGVKAATDAVAANAPAAGAAGTVLTSDGSTVAYATPVAPGPTYNLRPQNYRDWRKALSKVRAGTANAKLFVVGDSTSEGNGGATFGQNYPSILAGLLNSYYVPAAQTWMIPHNDVSAYDPRVTVGSPWNVSGGDFWQNTSTVGTISFAPSSGSCNGPTSTDTFDIYYFSNSGTFDVNVNGGSTLATSTASLGTVVKLTVTATASGSNVLNIVSKNNGNTFILAVNAYLSTLKQVQVGNRGIGATRASDWAKAVPAVYEYQNYYTHYQPDLVVLDLGINDAGISGASAATYATNMQTCITRAGTYGDVMLKSFVPGSDASYQTYLPQYLVQLRALSTTNSLALIDGFSRWESYAISNPLGYYADNIHPSSFGYADVAQAVMNALQAL